jgi:hypothetical protein
VRESVSDRAADPLVLAGPAGIVTGLVSACLAAMVDDLAAQLRKGASSCDVQLEAARAWIATALECRTVEEFCFDEGVDPAHAW